MSSQAASFALWALAGLHLLLFASPVLCTPRGPRHESDQHHDASAALLPSKRFADSYRGFAHHNPPQAPPESLQEALGGLSAELSASSFLVARDMHHSIAKRDALRCDDGPCIDGSCCSKDKICGFGPDYCGTGCLSQCNATAMCGEYSENADMPCGMKLCCSAMGWCGVSPPCYDSPTLRIHG